MKEVLIEKNRLVVVENNQPVFLAQVSTTFEGHLDVMRFEGLVEHPLPHQALRLAKKAGVAETDFRRAFGHLLGTSKPSSKPKSR